MDNPSAMDNLRGMDRETSALPGWCKACGEVVGVERETGRCTACGGGHVSVRRPEACWVEAA